MGPLLANGHPASNLHTGETERCLKATRTVQPQVIERLASDSTDAGRTKPTSAIVSALLLKLHISR